MFKIVLVRPGCTDFDQQGRIKGTLDIPLSEDGSKQAARTAEALAPVEIDVLYSAPCRSAQQTAQVIASSHRLKTKVIDDLQNIDHGLWHGKRIDEVKQLLPRVYREGQENPENVCPPQGEPIAQASQRVRCTLKKLLKKHRDEVVCLVVSEPLASIVACELQHIDLADLWQSECDDGKWDIFDVAEAPGAELAYRGVVQEPHVPACVRVKDVAVVGKSS